jgi:hypothetical protein
MELATGRHRKRGVSGLVTLGLLIALGLGLLGGIATDRFLLGGADSGTSAPTPPAPREPAFTTAPSSASPQDQPPAPTAGPAHPDPEPPGPQGSEAYLARLANEGLPVAQHRDVILVLGRVVCEAPPADPAATQAAADRVATAAGDLLTPEQTLQLVQLATKELCGT